MFAVPKLKRLMEDESLRELACSKLNLGLENKLTEDEFVKEIVSVLICSKILCEVDHHYDDLMAYGQLLNH